MLTFLRTSGQLLGAVFATKIAHDLYYMDWGKAKETLKKDAVHFMRTAPLIRGVVNKQIDKDLTPKLEALAQEIADERDPNSPFTTLNHDPVPYDVLLSELEKLHEKFDAKSLYKVSGAVYLTQDDEALNDFKTQIAALSSYSNPLHPDIWPKLQAMAAEVVNSCFTLFKAQNPQMGFGYITPGGTFSLIEACRAYRNQYYESQNTLRKVLGYVYSAQPEIIVPDTAHAGFEKAAKLLGCKLIKVPVDPVTRRADVKAMEKQITKNTILIAGSAPSYPTGSMDDIESLGKLAVKYNIGLHVDACLGGFVVPFMDKTPYRFGFDVPGVSSISVDTHKEGGGDKGSSVILYKSRETYGKYQMSTHMDWSGGLYATPGMGGSASGYAICSAWAMTHAKAHQGYVEDTQNIRKIVSSIAQQVAKVDDIEVMGKPDANVIALTSKTLNPHIVADILKERGWMFNVLPDGFHFCVTGVHIKHKDFIKEFMKDLKESVAFVKSHPELKARGNGAIYGATKALPDVMTPLKEHMAREYLGLQWRVPDYKREGSESLSAKKKV